MSKARNIIAIGGGGFGANPGQGIIEEYILKQTKKKKPKICFIPTATGDNEAYKVNFYATFTKLNCEPSHLDFFKRTPDLKKLILDQDAIFVGGGIAHGPKGQDNYKTRKLNKSEKKMSIASLITEKNKSNNVIIFDDFGKKIEKTKEMFELLKKFDANNSLLIVDTKSKDNILRSTKNIPNVKLTDANHFSAFDLVKYKKIIFTESSVKELEKRYQ